MNRWIGLGPLVQQIKGVIVSTIQNPIANLASRITKLEHSGDGIPQPRTERKSNASSRESQDQVLNALFTSANNEDMHQPLTNEAKINDNIFKLKDDVKTLMACTSGDGFKLRNFNFQSSEELKIWVKQHAVGQSFLFIC